MWFTFSASHCQRRTVLSAPTLPNFWNWKPDDPPETFALPSVCVATSNSFCFYLLAIYRTLLEWALRLCHLLNVQKKDTLPYIWPALSELFVPDFSSTVISLHLASIVTADITHKTPHVTWPVRNPVSSGIFSFMKPNLVLPAPFALGAVRFDLVVSKVFVNGPCTDARSLTSRGRKQMFFVI
jgi:hypothetical protein